ncbi:asparaginase [Pseudosulfitobacter koreensis]|uniref:Asparaginase n=1 Tax=Pseudosulfitobacter koreensis TaxID=2968472 RepID=A0ABT1YWX6_9RHOB|nr:asparaginase [Pseudosulfitobacter koreense]MCR8825386.1 asparaginase [Pseudosulfitobacter koreense]
MSNAVSMAEVWRGPFLESVHRGHAVVCDDTGQIVHAWGDPQATVLPRSSSKMLQALPLIESGAADAFGLGTEHLALACASHNGAAIHTERVAKWLDHLDLGDDDFRCGPQEPDDRDARNALIRAQERPCQMHNNCSGKHSGFLTLNKHLGAGPDYVDPDHAVQRACLEAFERVTGESSPGFGIDGCSAPNFATSLHGMARAMAHFAAAPTGSAEERLRTAMTLHPELVAGEGRACTNLMRAMGGKVAIKTGAEAFFIAIIPELKMGVALKIEDGGTRAAECAIAAILVKLGVLEPDHPETLKYLNAPIRNRCDLITGAVRAAPALI